MSDIITGDQGGDTKAHQAGAGPSTPMSQEISNNRERGVRRELIGRFSEQSHLKDYILTRETFNIQE